MENPTEYTRLECLKMLPLTYSYLTLPLMLWQVLVLSTQAVVYKTYLSITDSKAPENYGRVCHLGLPYRDTGGG